MPSLIVRMRKEVAVYWAHTGVDDYGHPVYADPVEIACRWEGVAEEFIDKDGTRALSRAKVYVDRDMKVGDKLMLATLDSIQTTSSTSSDWSPNNFIAAYEIRNFAKIPNLRAKEYLRIATF